MAGGLAIAGDLPTAFVAAIEQRDRCPPEVTGGVRLAHRVAVRRGTPRIPRLLPGMNSLRRREGWRRVHDAAIAIGLRTRLAGRNSACAAGEKPSSNSGTGRLVAESRR